MVGYCESLTDPSYHAQLLTLTYPLIGNYGVPSPDDHRDPVTNLPHWFESSRIWAAGLIVDEVCSSPSHWSSARTLHDWLKEQGVLGIRGVDTRKLTQKIREKGTMLAKIVVADDNYEGGPIGDEDAVEWVDPAKVNLVAEVSVKTRETFNEGGHPRICAVDCGLKYNQLRCLIKRGARVDVVPWDHRLDQSEYDGLFLSNGPGDPQKCAATVANIKRVITSNTADSVKPIFGICLGHQLLGAAAGCSTKKMKYSIGKTYILIMFIALFNLIVLLGMETAGTTSPVFTWTAAVAS